MTGPPTADMTRDLKWEWNDLNPLFDELKTLPVYQKEEKLTPLFDHLKTLPVYQKEEKLIPLFADVPYVMMEVSKLEPLFEHLRNLPEYMKEQSKLQPLFEDLKSLPTYSKEDKLSPLFDELKTLPVYQKEEKLIPLFADVADTEDAAETQIRRESCTLKLELDIDVELDIDPKLKAILDPGFCQKMNIESVLMEGSLSPKSKCYDFVDSETVKNGIKRKFSTLVTDDSQFQVVSKDAANCSESEPEREESFLTEKSVLDDWDQESDFQMLFERQSNVLIVELQEGIDNEFQIISEEAEEEDYEFC
jgi:hypothetical protein